MNKFIMLFLISSSLYSQSYTVSDSIFIEHLNATKDICRQLSYINKSLADLKTQPIPDTFSVNDSLYTEIEYLQERIDSSTKSLNNLTVNLKKEDTNHWVGFLPDTLSKAIAAFLGFIGAWIIFLFGRKSEKKQKRQEGIDANRKKNEYLRVLVSSQIHLSEEQQNSNNDYAKAIDKDPSTIPLLVLNVFEDSKRLTRTLSDPDYFEAYTDTRLSKHGTLNEFRNLTGLVDIIDALLEQVIEMRKIVQTNNRDRTTEFGEKSKRMMTNFIETTRTIEENEPGKEVYFRDIMSDYRVGLEGNLATVQYTMDKLYKPISHVMDNVEFETDLTQIAINLGAINSDYKGIVGNLIQHSISFKNINEQLKEHTERLKELVE